MAAPGDKLLRVVLTLICAALAVVLSDAAPGETIRVWKIGSPHRGDSPATTEPAALQQESTRLGLRLTVEAFPARGFAATFLDAATRNAAPDVLAFDNFGVMDGITTALGTFEGIGQEPTIRRDLIRVTGALDDLLRPARGWTYLVASSPNHQAARRLALRAPDCPNGFGAELQGELVELVPRLAQAYLEGNAIGLQAHSDPDHLPSLRSRPENVTVGAVRACGIWGNDKLAFARVNTSYDAESAIGQALALLVLRKPRSQWQLLVTARDPISTDPFVREVPRITALLARDERTYAPAVPATLLSPGDRRRPRPVNGQRFGSFEWQSSPSVEVVAEIVEFAYDDDARLFIRRPARPLSRGQISAGQLWTTGSVWKWRVWSITRTGDVAFSNVWTFPNERPDVQ